MHAFFECLINFKQFINICNSNVEFNRRVLYLEAVPPNLEQNKYDMI
jgi:hypothetical protein